MHSSSTFLSSGCQPAAKRPKAAADSPKYFEVILSCNICYGARPHLAVRHAACGNPPRLV
jgi:hypothetical protein